jgi:hypothetical protein
MASPIPPTVASVTVPPASSNAPFRYVMAAILIVFAMAMALILAWFKEPITVTDGAIIGTALLFGLAFASESTFTFVVTKAAPFVPFGRRKDDG